MNKFSRYLKGCYLALFSPFVFAFSVPSAPDMNVQSYILVDYHSNKVLAEKDSEKRIDPASLTKMMTVYIVDAELESGRLSLDQEIAVSDKAWRTEGSRMFVETGKKIKVDDLLKGVIIQSGNDASVALAEYVAGTEEAFAELMNQQAAKLGMKNTHFTNATGIPDSNHYTTAKDLSILSQALVRDFPDSYKVYSEKWFTFNGIRQPNRNRLLWSEPTVDGIKTGHSSTAGFCLAASALKDGMRLISIIVGAENDNQRNQYSQQLLRYGFRFYETHRLFEAQKPIESSRIWMGTKKNVSLGLTQDLYITIPQGTYKDIDAKIHVEKNLQAPVAKGSLQGKLTVSIADNLVAEQPLIALEGVDKGSLWMRVQDYVSLGFHKVLKSKESEA
ncbi:MAG: D-alanyl-D-alanine carboxypeptidase family protein [Candidatus Berkiella sp.]